jgi:hypothetical protein
MDDASHDTATQPAELGAAQWADGRPRSRRNYDLAGSIGMQLSEPLADMQRLVQTLMSTGKISRAQVHELGASIDNARRLTMQAQQLARLARGKLRESHERLSLDGVVRQALAERSPFFYQRGIELQQQLNKVEIIIDPGLLASLIEAAIDCVCSQSHRLVVMLDVRGWPETGWLTLRSNRPGKPIGGFEHDEFDTLAWHLLGEVALHTGVKVQRSQDPDGAELSLELPRTVRQLEETMTPAPETEFGTDSWIASESRSLSGHPVLLVTPDDALAREVSDVCANMALPFSWVESVARARNQFAVVRAHVIVVDRRLQGPELTAWLGQVHAEDPRLPTVEIEDESNTLAMSSWLADNSNRVTRGSVRVQLPQVLLLELAKSG